MLYLLKVFNSEDLHILESLKVRWLPVDLIYYVKKLLLFIIFTTSFVGSILLTNRPCYYHLFQFMQHDHFWYLNRVILTHGKYLQFRVNALSYCFPVIKWYTFHYLIKSDQFQENRPLLKYCNCLIHGVIKD